MNPLWCGEPFYSLPVPEAIQDVKRVPLDCSNRRHQGADELPGAATIDAFAPRKKNEAYTLDLPTTCQNFCLTGLVLWMERLTIWHDRWKIQVSYAPCMSDCVANRGYPIYMLYSMSEPRFPRCPLSTSQPRHCATHLSRTHLSRSHRGRMVRPATSLT